MSDSALVLRDLQVSYGGISAVKGISLEVGRGEIVTLIGANGAGKTSTLKAIVGVVLVPEGRAIFGNLTVQENLELGAFLKREPQERAARLDRVLKLFPRLSERMAQEA